MNRVFDIRIQKLFLIAFVLKVSSSFLGWKFQDPWILGFTVPLLIMSGYIVLGHFRRDDEVTDEKFADTCYYLGFIFTMTSIIFSLFDLPQIGTKIQDIAVRFGAAMVSTIFGLVVRVYLVSFKKEVADAVKDAEDALLDATRKFTEQLTVVLERLRDFEGQVDTAAKASVERVNLQVDSLSKNHADKLTAFFADLTNKNQEAFTAALSEVRVASHKLAESVDEYSFVMSSSLGSIEAKVVSFTDAVTERLKTTTFPDDYFAKQLSSPLSQMKESSAALATGIKDSLQEVTESGKVLSLALKALKNKANATENSLEIVLGLTQQQQAVLDTAQGQVTSLEQLGHTLKALEGTLATTAAGVVSSSGFTSKLTARVEDIVADGTETREVLKVSLSGITETLKAQVQATSTAITHLDASTASSRDLVQQMASSNGFTSELTARLESILEDGAETRETLKATLNGVTENLRAQVQATNTAITSLDAGAVLNKELAQHVVSSNVLTSELTARVEGILADSAVTREAIKTALSGVTETLKAQVQATTTTITSLDEGTTLSKELAQYLASKLDAVVDAEVKAAQALDALTPKANIALDHMNGFAGQLQEMVRQLSALDVTLRSRSTESQPVEHYVQNSISVNPLQARTAPGA